VLQIVVSIFAEWCRRLNELVNQWMSMNISPAEFAGTKRLGYVTQTSTVKGIRDEVFISKLTKERAIFILFSHFVLVFFVGSCRMALAH
jgi:hypothetical protein